MAKPLAALIKQLPKVTQRKIRAHAGELIAAEKTLRELREAHQQSQEARKA